MNHCGLRAKRHAVGSPLDRMVRHCHTVYFSNSTVGACVPGHTAVKSRLSAGTLAPRIGACSFSDCFADSTMTLCPESTAVHEASPLGRADLSQDPALAKRCLTQS
jgi:hypothetical protein